MKTLSVKTNARTEMINITAAIERELQSFGIQEGILFVFVPHTTAAITINESADPDVRKDMTAFLNQLVPDLPSFKHMEGNSDAHIKTSLIGTSEQIIISKGKLQLGSWQAIYFCEFDGPRNRQIYLRAIKQD